MIDERDEDRDLLEAHLDGALAPAEAEALGRRLVVDARLAAALEDLRAERAVRRAVWGAYEPTEAEAAGAARRVAAAAARDERWRHASRMARLVTAVAAAVVVAFAGGWIARGQLGSGEPAPAVRSSDGARPFASTGGGEGAGSFPVALTDESGRIIAVQHFDDPQSARQFADDVGRWQSRPSERRRAPEAERFVPMSGEF